MTNNKKFYVIITAFLVLVGMGAFVFYKYNKTEGLKLPEKSNAFTEKNSAFIEQAVQAPPVEGDVINSGIAGRVTMADNKPFEASLDIFLDGDTSKPFISVRSHDDGVFQIPLKPGSYILKPLDPDGPVAPVRDSYNFTIGNSQWLQVKVEYK